MIPLKQYIRKERARKMKKIKNKTPLQLPVKDLSSIKKKLNITPFLQIYVGTSLYIIEKKEEGLPSTYFTIKAVNGEGSVGYDKRLKAYIANIFEAG